MRRSTSETLMVSSISAKNTQHEFTTNSLRAYESPFNLTIVSRASILAHHRVHRYTALNLLQQITKPWQGNSPLQDPAKWWTICIKLWPAPQPKVILPYPGGLCWAPFPDEPASLPTPEKPCCAPLSGRWMHPAVVASGSKTLAPETWAGWKLWLSWHPSPTTASSPGPGASKDPSPPSIQSQPIRSPIQDHTSTFRAVWAPLQEPITRKETKHAGRSREGLKPKPGSRQSSQHSWGNFWPPQCCRILF